MHWLGSLLVGSRATILTEISPKYISGNCEQRKRDNCLAAGALGAGYPGALDKGELKLADYDLSCWRTDAYRSAAGAARSDKTLERYFPKMQYDTNYGLSESTGPGCIHLGIENEHKVGAIGKPGYSWQARIVDDKGNDVPQGKNGEIIVKGPV